MLPSLSSLEALDVAYARFNAVRSLRPHDPELRVTENEGMTVLHDPSRPQDETYNRVVGLTQAHLPLLAEVLTSFGEVTAQVDVPVDRMTPEVCDALSEHRLRPVQSVVWLWADPAAMDHAQVEGVSVRRLEGEAGLLLDLIGSISTPIGDEVRAQRAGFYCTQTFRAYLASVDSEPAGWATLWVDRGVGILGNADTLPEFRRRGVQSALYRARARDAATLELPWVVTDVAPETSSHRNALRAGMQRRTTNVWWRQ